MEALSTAIILNAPVVTTFNESYDNRSVLPTNCMVLNIRAGSIPWDNPHNLISRLVTRAWEKIVHGMFLPTLFLISIPTNALNMAVFFKQGLKERINLCLFFLSFADFVYVAQAFCVYADRIYLELTNQPLRGALIQFMVNNNIIGLYGFCWTSSWMTTIIACERCFCVLRPLRSQTVLKTQTMWVIILVSFTVLVGGAFITTIRWKIVCVFSSVSNFAQLALYPSDFFLQNKDLVDILDSVVYGLIIQQFCIITITTATIVTIVQLRSMAKWRKKSSLAAATLSNRDIALTRMLIGTSVLYIVLLIPGGTLRITMLFVKELSAGGRFYNTFNLLKLVDMLFTYANSSFNFFIYYTFSSKYRATLTSLCCKKTALNRKTANTGDLHRAAAVPPAAQENITTRE